MFAGVLTALVTPFKQGALDEKALCELVERQVQAQVDGVVPCGTTGESPTLSDEEHQRVIELVVAQAKKRVHVVAGAGSASTKKTIHHCEVAKAAGADGVLLVSPYYNKPTQEGLYQHYAAVAQAVSLPMILYNIPGRTGVDMSLETIERLAAFKHIVAIKEATGNVLKAQQIRARLGDRFTLLSGDDTLTVPMMAAGAAGVISVTSNLLPVEVKSVVRFMAEGKWAQARDQHLKLVAVHESMFVETNPGPIKYALAQQGWIAPEIRLPMVWPSEGTQHVIKAALAGLR